MKETFYNKTWRLKHCYKIIGRSSKELPFIRNHAQDVVRAKIKEIRERNQGKKRLQLIILKWRQLGITTYACIDNLDEVIMHKNLNACIVAHKLDKQRDIFKKVEYAFDHFPNRILLDEWLFIKPETRFKNASEIFLKTNSWIKVNLDSRSWTFQRVHITELAFRDDAEEMLTWTLPSVPDEWWEVIIETTANWVWNYFHTLRQNNWNNPEAEWDCLFLWWWLETTYAHNMDTNEPLVLPDELKHLNQPMIDWTILTEDQKRWYYSQWKTLWDSVFQEYPNTPDEAFLNTWDPVFNLNTVKQYATLPFRIDTEYKDLRIYQPPKYKYCLFGVDTSWWWDSWDYSSIRVRDQDLNLLAAYYWHHEPDELCQIIDRLFKLWYMGILGIESNNTWIWTLTKAKEYPRYSMIYTETTVDRKTNRKTKKIWWNTNSKTRPLLISDYKMLVREWLLPNIDEPLRHEMFHFVYNESQRPEASKWEHDDAIMSDAICCYMRNNPIYVNPSP